MLLPPLLLLASALAVPTEAQYFGAPSAMQVVERGASARYVVLTQKAPLRAEVTGPGTLHIEVRAPLRRAQKKAKRASLRVLVDTVESGRFPLDLRQAPRASKTRFQGAGAPRGRVPSAAQVITLPVESGTFFVELQLDGVEPQLLVTMGVEDAVVEAAPEPLPAEVAALPALPGLPDLPGALDQSPLPDAAALNADEAPNATEAAPAVSYVGTPAEVTVEELGDRKVYREVSSTNVLRAEITGPGTLRVGVRGVLATGAATSLVLRIDVDGTERGAFPVQLEPPASAATRFVEGDRAGAQPSAEAWFDLEMPAGTTFCSVALEPADALAYVALDLAPTVASVALTQPAKDQALLSRDELERLQQLSASGAHEAHELGTGWRLALEVAGGAYTPLVAQQVGYGARIGVQLTAPWLHGALGLSLSGAVQQASGVVSGVVEGREASVVEVPRRRRLVPLEGGMHLLLRPSRRLRVLVEGGGGQYWIEVTRDVWGTKRTMYRSSHGGWGSLRLGFAFHRGMVFIAGRGYGAGAVSNRGGTTSIVGASAELGYSVDL